MLEWLQDSALSGALRRSIWVYPLVNAGHILGLALLIGSIVPVDLRLLGCWPRVPLGLLSSVLLPVARAGLTLAIICGALLFVTQPHEYIAAELFQSKMLLLALAVVNAYLLSTSAAWSEALTTNQWGTRVKTQAVTSLVLWISVLLLGRLIGYR